jgi:hypothetical protein
VDKGDGVEQEREEPAEVAITGVHTVTAVTGTGVVTLLS